MDFNIRRTFAYILSIIISGGFFMPKNKFQDAVFTAIMAAVMVYGMIVYNVAWNTDGVSAMTFLAALHEMPIMFPIAFVLEFFIVGKLAAALAFRVMRPR